MSLTDAPVPRKTLSAFKLLRSMALVLGTCLMLMLALDMLGVGEIRPVEGTQHIQQVKIASNGTPVSLPWSGRAVASGQTISMAFEVDIVLEEPPTIVYGVYFPRLSDKLTLTLNGSRLYEPDSQLRLRNKPLLIAIPTQTLHAGTNHLQIELRGERSENLVLHSFHFGPYGELMLPYRWRFAFGPGLARSTLGLMLVMGLMFSMLWSIRPGESRYLWVAAAYLTSVGTLFHLGFGRQFLNYKAYTLIWSGGILLHVYFIIGFLLSFARIPDRRTRIGQAWVIAIFLFPAILLPADYSLALTRAGGAFSGVMVAATIAVIYEYRDSMSRSDFLVITACAMASLAFGFRELKVLVFDPAGDPISLFHYTSLLVAVPGAWLVLSALLRNTSALEDLNVSIQKTVAEQIDIIRERDEQLLLIQNSEAIARERSRIMMDLHDGVGGQLTNVLAYIDTQSKPDPVVHDLLDDALRDMGLIVDGLNHGQDIAAMLSKMQRRMAFLVEGERPLLTWEIREDPVFHGTMSDNVAMLRMIQEAITNALRHADADHIVIRAERGRIEVRDDGCGFDVEKMLGSEKSAGLGLRSMASRAETLGVTLDIVSTPGTGTRVCASWPSA